MFKVIKPRYAFGVFMNGLFVHQNNLCEFHNKHPQIRKVILYLILTIKIYQTRFGLTYRNNTHLRLKTPLNTTRIFNLSYQGIDCISQTKSKSIIYIF